VVTSAEQALDEAHLAALDQLIAAEKDPGHGRWLSWARDAVAARVEPLSLDVAARIVPS